MNSSPLTRNVRMVPLRRERGGREIITTYSTLYDKLKGRESWMYGKAIL